MFKVINPVDPKTKEMKDPAEILKEVKPANVIFLAGPCPRTDYTDDWRPKAVEYLRHHNFDGVIFSPTNPNYDKADPQYPSKQANWEQRAIHLSHLVVFWIPRTDKDPAFTTNIEIGEFLTEDKVDHIMVGMPDFAIKTNYIKIRLEMLGKSYDNDLETLMKHVVEALGKPTDIERRKLHMETIITHISIVRDLCYQLGIPELGDTHDLSKLSPDEFGIYKWANGKKSPHDNARDVLGYSPNWMCHYHRNKHHWQYYLDISDATPKKDGSFTITCKCVKMPYKRVVEMLCDFVGAGKAYSKEKWDVHTPLNYWKARCEGQNAMHPDSKKLIVKLLTTLDKSASLDEFVKWYNTNKSSLEAEYGEESK